MKRCSGCRQVKDLTDFHRNGKHPRCRECVREYDRQYRLRNGDRLRAAARRRLAAPQAKAEALERHRRWREANREKVRDSHRQIMQKWRAANPEKAQAAVALRRARQLGVEHEPINVQKLGERDRWRCGICGRKVDPDLRHPHLESRSIDHMIPLSLGGADTYANAQLAHLRCNVRKQRTATGEQLRLVG